MIDNGYNGYLMNNGNIDDLAIDLIIYLNKLTTKYQKFSAGALDKVKPFSNEKITKYSVRLFENTKVNVKVIRYEAKLVIIEQKN